MSCPRSLAKFNIFKQVKGRVVFGEPLERHTTFRIGGPTRVFIEPCDEADLKLSVCLAKRYKIPVFVIGFGSNILASDKGVNGMLLHLGAPSFKKISVKAKRIIAGCGVGLKQLITKAQESGLSGLEPFIGIPGTVGGALSMNAGCWGRDIAMLVEKVRVMDYNGKIKTLTKKGIRFGYRKSSLASYIILSATLRLTGGDSAEIKGSIKKFLNQRRRAQAVTSPNAGCIFKNPPGEAAGRLIDLCGLKGRSSGGAAVSMRHANFIINRGGATSSDVLKLMGLIKKKVKHRFNINLEPEIKIWG